jgi:hypothetical protein
MLVKPTLFLSIAFSTQKHGNKKSKTNITYKMMNTRSELLPTKITGAIMLASMRPKKLPSKI